MNNRCALVASFEYNWATRQGQVQGVGDVQFRKGKYGLPDWTCILIPTVIRGSHVNG